MWKWILLGIATGVLWTLSGPWVGGVVLAIHLRRIPWQKPEPTRLACDHDEDDDCGSSYGSYKPGKVWVAWSHHHHPDDWRCDKAPPLPVAKVRA